MIANSNISSNQQTIRKSFSLNGIGLHSGKKVKIIVEPAKVNNGIKFIRTDLKKDNIVPALWSNVSSTNLCTTISNEKGVSVSTIEHLMSALSGMHIDNALIEIDGPEVPIMDGSSKVFVELIEKVKLIEQNSQRKILKVIKEIKVENNESYAKIIPHKEFSVDFEIEFDSHLINKQSCHLQLINGNYKSDISKARTFGFEEDVNYLRSNGFALGGNLDNAVVVGKDKILNKEGLRYKDEFVRHKILDSIGDLYLAGYPVQGYFYGKKSGHFLNNELLKKLLSSESNYKII